MDQPSKLNYDRKIDCETGPKDLFQLVFLSLYFQISKKKKIIINKCVFMFQLGDHIEYEIMQTGEFINSVWFNIQPKSMYVFFRTK